MEMTTDVGEVAENTAANQPMMLVKWEMCAVGSAALQTSFSLGELCYGI